MKEIRIRKVEDNELSLRWDGWIDFGEFIGWAISYIHSRCVCCDHYNLIGYEVFSDEDHSTIELGQFVVADHNGCVMPRIARIGIEISKHEGKREFRVLGVDFDEAVQISCISGNVYRDCVDEECTQNEDKEDEPHERKIVRRTSKISIKTTSPKEGGQQ